MYRFLLLLVLNVCTNLLVSQNVIHLNYSQGKQFADILNYIKASDSIEFPVQSKISEKQGQYYFNKHKNDIILNKKINSLLQIPIYKALCRNFHAWDGKKKLSNSDAYQYAFWSLPQKGLKINGGVTDMWMNYFTKEKQQNALLFFTNIEENKESIEKNVSQKARNFLPQQAISNDSFSVYLGFDGNRGSFEDKEGIFIDLIYEKLDMDMFNLVLAHELHHQYYTKYLKNKSYRIRNKALLWQIPLVLEGSAQLINYDKYPEEIKNLYNNKKLLNELFIEFCNSLKKIDSAKNKKQIINKLNDYYFQEFAIKKFKEYLPDTKNKNELIGYRPTLHYYLGYTLFNTIYTNKGKEELFKAMLNPEKLLHIYNQSRDNSCILPVFSDDIIAIWEKNFRRN